MNALRRGRTSLQPKACFNDGDSCNKSVADDASMARLTGNILPDVQSFRPLQVCRQLTRAAFMTVRVGSDFSAPEGAACAILERSLGESPARRFARHDGSDLLQNSRFLQRAGCHDESHLKAG
jgi:hypothetical protein